MSTPGPSLLPDKLCKGRCSELTHPAGYSRAAHWGITGLDTMPGLVVTGKVWAREQAGAAAALTALWRAGSEDVKSHLRGLDTVVWQEAGTLAGSPL